MPGVQVPRPQRVHVQRVQGEASDPGGVQRSRGGLTSRSVHSPRSARGRHSVQEGQRSTVHGRPPAGPASTIHGRWPVSTIHGRRPVSAVQSSKRPQTRRSHQSHKGGGEKPASRQSHPDAVMQQTGGRSVPPRWGRPNWVGALPPPPSGRLAERGCRSAGVRWTAGDDGVPMPRARRPVRAAGSPARL